MKRASHKSNSPIRLQPRALLIVLSGPSGAGKDAILSRMKKADYPIEFITTLTTRPQRASEKNNVDYHFVSLERFQEMIDHKQLLEWAKVYGNWYGVPREPITQALDRGRDIIVKVDIQGASKIKRIMPQAVFIFLMPPSMEELASRLKQRHTESSFDLSLRLKTAEEEMKQLSLFDYAIVNKQDKIDLAVSTIEAIITAEKHRVTTRDIGLQAD